MRLGILTTASDSYSTQRLQAMARSRGHDVHVLETQRFGLELGADRPITFRGLACPDFDAVLPRIGPSISRFGLAVLRQFEALGCPSLNPSYGVAASRDKLHALQLLGAEGLAVPRTTQVKERSEVRGAIERLGGPPVIIKPLEGSQGIGVILAENTASAEATVEALQAARVPVLLQQFVSTSRGRDLRVIVIGGEAVAAMRRTASSDEYRSNVHRGASVAALALDGELKRIAERATRVLGLGLAGVDLLEGPAGPLINEVNSSPGLQGIESATGQDLASRIVAQLEQLASKQRKLPSSKEPSQFRHLEVRVLPGSRWIGQPLGLSGLLGPESTVLELQRGSQRLPLPGPSTLLLAGDRLLCFGRPARIEARESCISPVDPERPEALI